MKKFLTLILSTFILGSCSNDIIENYSPNDQTEKHNIEFLYKGVKYSSTYSYTPDSLIVYDNKEVESILNKIANLPESSTLINEDGTIELYDDGSELPTLIENEESITDSLSSLRVLPPSYMSYRSVTFFKDRNAKGSSHMHFLSYGLDINHIVAQGSFDNSFNNEISSIKTIGSNSPAENNEYRLVIYQYGNYTGRSLTMIINPGQTRIFNLGDYRYGSIFNTWNDKASSYRVYRSK